MIRCAVVFVPRFEEKKGTAVLYGAVTGKMTDAQTLWSNLRALTEAGNPAGLPAPFPMCFPMR